MPASVHWYSNTCEDAELFVDLDKSTYDDGDIISAHVRLVVLRPLAISGLTARLYCGEVIEWFDSDCSGFDRHTLVNEQTQLLSVDQKGQTFEPKEYEFHTKFLLPPGLPRFHYYRPLTGFDIETIVECFLWVPSTPKRHRLEAGKPFELQRHHVPWLPVGQSNFIGEDHSAVRLLGVPVGGRCRMRIELDRPGIQIEGPTAMTITIDSPKPKAKIKNIELVLVEQAFFPLGMPVWSASDNPWRRRKTVKCAAWQIPLDVFAESEPSTEEASAVATRHRLHGVYRIDVSKGHVHETVQLHLLTITYRMALYVTFHGGLNATVLFDTVQLLRD